jgi:hypothetical protein
MNEPTQQAVAILNLSYELNHKRDQEEWEWQMKQDKIEQIHDFMGEREQEDEA